MASEELTNRLAGKLAAADLADDEAALLISLIRSSGDEVEGFLLTSINDITFGVRNDPTKWIDVLNSSVWGDPHVDTRSH